MDEYCQLESWQYDNKNVKDKATLFTETFGIPFADLKPMQPSHTCDTHYIHTSTGDEYRYLYTFGHPYWRKEVTFPSVGGWLTRFIWGGKNK